MRFVRKMSKPRKRKGRDWGVRNESEAGREKGRAQDFKPDLTVLARDGAVVSLRFDKLQ
jgi:hypothetical protein